MLEIRDIEALDFSTVPSDILWGKADEPELKMHKIHSYPAKFPAFIATKAIAFAKERGINPRKVADVFCGCGTVAFEAKRNAIDFWGCDINPVATLIAEAKSQDYNLRRFLKYYKGIAELCSSFEVSPSEYTESNKRIQYWFKQEQFNDLFSLKAAIEKTVPLNSKYSKLFLCLFSSILKPCSVWLAKSIKPQVDPQKIPSDVMDIFTKRCRFIEAALGEAKQIPKSNVKINTADCLSRRKKPSDIDMIISSPPYVTSYEYADLHQLSSLWLGYAEDFRD